MLRALSVLVFVGNVSLRMAFGGETLQTVSGHAYTNATVVRMDPLGVNIIHSKGSARVLFSDLPRVTADRLGYDPAKAAEFQKQIESQRQEMADIALLQTQNRRRYNTTGCLGWEDSLDRNDQALSSQRKGNHRFQKVRF
jgi:hypothetical protein